MNTRYTTLLTLVALTTLGCGGHQTTAPTDTHAASQGTARFVVLFPEQLSRAIPVGTQSVVLYITGTGLAEPIKRPINRPQFKSSTRVEVEVLLPIGPKSIAAIARSQADGSGSTLASGMTNLTVEENKRHSIDLTLQTGPLLQRRDPPKISVITGATKASGATVTATGATLPYPQSLNQGLGTYSFTWDPPPAFLRAGDTIDFTITASAGSSSTVTTLTSFGAPNPPSYQADVHNNNGSGIFPSSLTSAEVSYDLATCYDGAQVIRPCSAPLNVRNVTRHISIDPNRSNTITVVVDYPSAIASVAWSYTAFEP